MQKGFGQEKRRAGSIKEVFAAFALCTLFTCTALEVESVSSKGIDPCRLRAIVLSRIVLSTTWPDCVRSSSMVKMGIVTGKPENYHAAFSEELFCTLEGMICLHVYKKRLKIMINLGRVKTSKINISSEVLRHARII